MFQNRSVQCVAALGLAAALACGAAFAQQQGPAERPGQERASRGFERLDRNQDRFVSPGEYEEWQQSAFGEVDVDRDDSLSELEFVVIGVRPVSPGEVQQTQARNQQTFKQLDRDADGKLTKEQYMKYGSKAFGEADSNKDGVLTEEEFEALGRTGG